MDIRFRSKCIVFGLFDRVLVLLVVEGRGSSFVAVEFDVEGEWSTKI